MLAPDTFRLSDSFAPVCSLRSPAWLPKILLPMLYKSGRAPGSCGETPLVLRLRCEFPAPSDKYSNSHMDEVQSSGNWELEIGNWELARNFRCTSRYTRIAIITALPPCLSNHWVAFSISFKDLHLADQNFEVIIEIRENGKLCGTAIL